MSDVLFSLIANLGFADQERPQRVRSSCHLANSFDLDASVSLDAFIWPILVAFRLQKKIEQKSKKCTRFH